MKQIYLVFLLCLSLYAGQMKLIRHEIHEEGENNSVKVKVSFKTEKKGAYETQVKVGQGLELEIEDVADAGFQWLLANKDDVESAGILKYDKEKEALAKGKKQAEEGKNEFENFFFKAVSVGKQNLNYILVRPWQRSMVYKLFEVHVEVLEAAKQTFRVMTEEEMKKYSNYFIENFDVYEFSQEIRDEVENIHNYMPGMDQELNLKYHTPISKDAFTSCTKSFPIMNQGQCGSCWAFASVGAIALQKCVQTGGKTVVNYSPQEFVECLQQGCNGGWPSKAFEYAIQYGVAPLSEIPYNDQKAGSGCKQYKTKSPRTFIKSGSVVRLATVNDVKAFILKNGALAGCVKLDTEGFGEWTPDKGPYTQPGAGSGQHGYHAMALAGWGTDQNGRLFWNYANSWGNDWGNKGWVSIYHETTAWEELGAPFIGAAIK